MTIFFAFFPEVRACVKRDGDLGSCLGQVGSTDDQDMQLSPRLSSLSTRTVEGPVAAGPGEWTSPPWQGGLVQK